MKHSIQTMYIVHHSHTDVGYTDLQERVIHAQAGYIRTVLQIMRKPENSDFRWNCETWFCVEEFLKDAAPDERAEFFRLVREGRIGLSATYLNFCDLVDSRVLGRRLDAMCGLLRENDIRPATAMIADINGISMGQRYALCRRLDEKAEEKYPALCRTAEGNLLLYAEHTWGHSSTITCPYDTMVLNLDMRKNGYASKAHESASMMLCRIAEEKGDLLRYYSTSGRLRVCAPGAAAGLQPVEFYIESPHLARVRIRRADGTALPCQVSPHPRGRLITFLDSFDGRETREYTFEELPPLRETQNSRRVYVGSERVRDIVNDYDPVSYRLPYAFENRWFRLTYRPGAGVTAFVNKATGRDMLAPGAAPFFTPLYERTAIRSRLPELACPEEYERRMLDRNIRGKHAALFTARLEEIVCRTRGAVFTELELRYTLPGTVHCSVFLKFYEGAPRVDFRLELGKTLSADIESVFLPLSLSLEDEQSLYLKKGGEAFRPGVDQIPGTCMEFYMSDDGLAFVGAAGSALIASRDVPLVYMGKMAHHPIRLCDNRPENNGRPVYSWVMNNLWETNFKMDLSGFCSFQYTLWLSDETDPEQAMAELHERTFDPYPLITG